MSPATVIEVGRLGGLGVLNLQGLWTRYRDPGPIYTEIISTAADRATAVLQEVYRGAHPTGPGGGAHPANTGCRSHLGGEPYAAEHTAVRSHRRLKQVWTCW